MSELVKLLGESPYETLTKTVNAHGRTLSEQADLLRGLYGWMTFLTLAVVGLLVGLWLVSRRTRKLSRRLKALETARPVSVNET